MILCLILFVILFIILSYNDLRKDLKEVIDFNNLNVLFLEEKIFKTIDKYSDCPQLEVEVFSYFVRVKYPTKYDVSGDEYYSTFYDGYEDVKLREDVMVVLTEKETDLLTKIIYKKLKSMYPNADVDYGKRVVTVEFYQ